VNTKQLWTVATDEAGRVSLPAELAKKLGLQPGVQFEAQVGNNEIRLLRPVSHLAKVYIEPTNICNLDCRTCMRNEWDEKPGRMSAKIFERILSGLKALSPMPTVFFGGIGEPLAHPRINEMVRQVKELGATVELITNGILLTEKRASQFIQDGLDTLWVSLDGATPECYSDVRLGASLPKVIKNLERLRSLRYLAHEHQDVSKPQLGIAFVAMQRNIADLPEVLRLGIRLGAKRFSVSNVLPYSPELRAEILYQRAIYSNLMERGGTYPVVNLPRIDTNSLTQLPLAEVYAKNVVLQVVGNEINRSIDVCQFIEQGSTAIRWDGQVSPCLPLLHDHNTYLADKPRRSHAYFIGSVLERDLLALWNDPKYVEQRQRIRHFDYSPCIFCNGCERSTENLEDCLANEQPTCGGCLWAQGLIQCP
jgi:MoaA/NifB/PqqE/SkfB family radical SAM enzyme